ncbi:MAG: hypothetical protein WCO23_04690 [bacterium]
MDLIQAQPGDSSKTIEFYDYERDNEIITNEECKKCLGKYDLTDQRISVIKDNLIGIVDSILNTYLEEFK